MRGMSIDEAILIVRLRLAAHLFQAGKLSRARLQEILEEAEKQKEAWTRPSPS